jgi:phosphonate transport system substrate-binding protein
MTQKAPSGGLSTVDSGSGGPGFIRLAVYLVLAASLGVAAFDAYQAMQARASVTQTQATLVQGMGLVEQAHKHLAAEYTDSTGKLVADAPTDPAKLLDPTEIVLAYTDDADTDNQQVDWKQLADNIAKATGKKVTLQPYQNTVGDVASVKAGKIQIVALRAADTPYIVNNAGFVPIGVLGGKSGAIGNKLDIAVPNSSPIHTLDDLKGHTLTCTVPSSITGYRAAVALLRNQAALQPNVDYYVTFSGKMKDSVKGVVKSEYEAAALSDDKVQAMVEAGKLKVDDFRTIFQSEVIPRLTIGYVYNLKPELADAIQKTVMSFDNANGAAEEDGGPPMRFNGVDYRKDFDLVRQIDDAFDPRFNSAAAEKAKKQDQQDAATTAPSAT